MLLGKRHHNIRAFIDLNVTFACVTGSFEDTNHHAAPAAGLRNVQKRTNDVEITVRSAPFSFSLLLFIVSFVDGLVSPFAANLEESPSRTFID